MSKRIMISGPHAIGKTTTAEKVAERYPSMLYMPSIAGRIAKEMGYDLNANPAAKDTLNYQWTLLEAVTTQYEATQEINTIYDRSPLDGAAYARLQLRDCKDDIILEELKRYMTQCALTTMAYCDLLIMPQADLTLPYNDKGNRPSFSEAQVKYRQTYAEMIKGYAEGCQLVKKLYVPVDKQYDDRIDYIWDWLED